MKKGIISGLELSKNYRQNRARLCIQLIIIYKRKIALQILVLRGHYIHLLNLSDRMKH